MSKLISSSSKNEKARIPTCAKPVTGESELGLKSGPHSEKALVSSMMEMYVQGVSTRKVARVTEELCDVSYSVATISTLTAKLDGELRKFATRRLEAAYPYLILDARYEKVRNCGTVQTQAVLIALGVGWDGQREVLAMELANHESTQVWKDFLVGLKERGLDGVEFVVSDDHCGIRHAVRETLPEVVWQRCYVHFLRNALDYMPRKADPDCMIELRWLYDRRNNLQYYAYFSIFSPLNHRLLEFLRRNTGAFTRDSLLPTYIFLYLILFAALNLQKHKME